MSNISVVFYSGYGHTKVIAQTFAQEIGANLVEIDPNGDIPEQDWQTLDQSDAIVFGAPIQKNGLLAHGKIKFSVALPIAQA